MEGDRGWRVESRPDGEKEEEENVNREREEREMWWCGGGTGTDYKKICLPGMWD